MSCWREQKVLRMPAGTIGLAAPEAWKAFYAKYRGTWSWDPGTFAPSLCESSQGEFLDYILTNRAPVEGDGCTMHARSLTPAEAEKYLPVFRKQFPGFTPEQMNDVHYCEYTWYDGTNAPYCY